jgi:hypothetical protein
MDAREHLIREKGTLLRQIAESAQRGQSQEVIAAGDKLSRIEHLIERYEDLLRDISDLNSADPKQGIIRKVRSAPKPMKNPDVVPGRGIGKEIRMGFLRKVAEKGIHLDQIRGTIYETPSGSKVGVAVATERNPDRWFLGVPIGLDQAVLLCQRENGDVATICLPKDFFAEYSDRMSKSGGQIKLNVTRRGSGYSLLVPGTDGINVSGFVADYSQLK